MGGDGAPLRLGVLDRLGQTDLLGHLGVLKVVPGQAVRAPSQRPHQGLVEQMFDHHRRVSSRHGGQGLATRLTVELGLVGLLVQVVVEDVSAPGAAGKAEVDVAVEPTGTHQGGVEIAGPVGGPDHEDVGRGVGRLAQPPVLRQPGIDHLDALAPHPQRPGRLFEGLQLDQQFVDHPRDPLTLAGA